MGVQRQMFSQDDRDNNERGASKTWEAAYRTVWRYARASVSSSNSRSSSLFAWSLSRPGKQHRWPYVTLVWGSCDCFDFFWPLELRARFVDSWGWRSSLSALMTASMSLLVAIVPKNVLERILKHYPRVDIAAGEECLQLRFEVMLVEELAAGG